MAGVAEEIVTATTFPTGIRKGASGIKGRTVFFFPEPTCTNLHGENVDIKHKCAVLLLIPARSVFDLFPPLPSF